MSAQLVGAPATLKLELPLLNGERPPLDPPGQDERDSGHHEAPCGNGERPRILRYGPAHLPPPLVTWALEVPGLRGEPYRDTRGPGLAGVRRLLRRIGRRHDAKGRRDAAILRLLFDLGLCRGELVRLDLGDLDVDTGALAVLGKGRTAKVALTLPEPTRDALRAWLEARGHELRPLFTNLARDRRGGRLSSTSVYRLVRRLGAQVGVTARPHGLRHTAITAALDLTGDLRAVQRFSRHRDPAILMAYDDNREDRGGDVARRVAATA